MTGRPTALPRPFWVLWAGSLLNRLGYLVQPFLALYLSSRLGVSTTTVGIVLASFGAGAVVSQPVGGWLADRIGPRRSLDWGRVEGGLTVDMLPFARGLVWVYVCVAV